MQTELTSYEQRKAQEAAVALARHQHAQAVADALAAYLTHGGSADWQVKLTPQEYGQAVIEVTDGHAIINVHPGGYRQQGRLVAFVPTVRYVEFGKDDWETVTVKQEGAEATVAETKSVEQAAKEFGRKLGLLANRVALDLDAEQARLGGERDKAQAIVAEFRRAGWVVSEYNGTGRVQVPEGHALRALGITGFKVDLETGGIDYDYRTYLPHDIVPATLIGITL